MCIRDRKDDPVVPTDEGDLLLYNEVRDLNGRKLGNTRRWEAAATLAIKNSEKWEGPIEDFAKFVMKI